MAEETIIILIQYGLAGVVIYLLFRIVFNDLQSIKSELREIREELRAIKEEVRRLREVMEVLKNR